MTTDRKPDPDCSECGGTGVVTIHRSIMDREEEMSVPCPRCMRGEAGDSTRR
jgi:DnaJ-class molecular chaperone